MQRIGTKNYNLLYQEVKDEIEAATMHGTSVFKLEIYKKCRNKSVKKQMIEWYKDNLTLNSRFYASGGHLEKNKIPTMLSESYYIENESDGKYITVKKGLEKEIEKEIIKNIIIKEGGEEVELKIIKNKGLIRNKKRE